MANYKNQNTIVGISVEKIRHNEGVHESWMQPFSWEKMAPIMFLLNGNEYKFYMYLLKWAGKGSYEFSPVNLSKCLNFGEDTARKIFKRFLELGFLVQDSARKHNYIFDAYPEKAIIEYQKQWIEKYGV